MTTMSFASFHFASLRFASWDGAPASGARESIDSLRKRSTPALSESGRIHGGIAPLTDAIAHGTLMHRRQASTVARRGRTR
jgi:hypothetical protein